MITNSKHILLVNLGSPAGTQTRQVRSYLREFLDDPRVIDLPTLLRRFILYAFILPRRPAKSARAYASIWRQEGSPLVYHTRVLSESLQEFFNKNKLNSSFLPVHVHWAMRYGSPSLETVLKKINMQPGDQLTIVPLYPQYATSTTGTALAEIYRLLSLPWNTPSLTLKVIPPWYKHPLYIDCLSKSVQKYLPPSLSDLDTHSRILFSFHGLPHRHLQKSSSPNNSCLAENYSCCEKPSVDHTYCYRAQCHQTSVLLAKSLGLKQEQWTLCFQSRLGAGKWTLPSTQDTLIKLAREGIKHIYIVAPSFICDCLETLEELAQAGKEIFLENGGQSFCYIPCLNSDHTWVETLAHLTSDSR